MAQTGNTATLTNAGGWVGVFLRIGSLSQVIDDLDDSELSNPAITTRVRGDLIDLEPIECDIF